MKKFFLSLLILVIIFQTFVPVNAASYPLMYPEEYKMTVKQGDIANLKFTIFHEYNYEKYHVNVYKGTLVDIANGTAQLVASAEDDFRATTYKTDLTITWDTSSVECGLYTVEYYMSFYSIFEWRDEPTKHTLMTVTVEDPWVFEQNATAIKVKLNGNNIAFDQAPIIENGRTLVPLRAIFESLGATVEWDDYTKSVFASKNGVDIKLSIGQCEMYKNGAMIWLDSAPIIKEGRTLVPVRAIAEAFGCQVDWIEADKTVIITQ